MNGELKEYYYYLLSYFKEQVYTSSVVEETLNFNLYLSFPVLISLPLSLVQILTGLCLYVAGASSLISEC